MMLLVATMAAVFSHRLNAEMQIGLTSNYAYSEGSVKIDGRDWHYVEMEDYVSHIHVGYDVLKPKGRDPFGVLLFLSIDTSNSNVYGDDVVVDDYLLEDDD